MRVFLCTLSNFSLAIPMHSISSLSLYSDTPYSGTTKQNNAIMYNQQTRTVCVSLPLLFNLPEEEIWHCIILKNLNCTDTFEDTDTTEKKIILLIPKVERETDIPKEEICPLPKVLNDMHLTVLFSGIQFKTVPVFLLNCEQLIQYIKRETAP